MAQRRPTHARHAPGKPIHPAFVVGVLLLSLCITVAGGAIVYGFTQDMNPIDAAKLAAHNISQAAMPSSSPTNPQETAAKPPVSPSAKTASAPRDKTAPASSSSGPSRQPASSSRAPQLPTPVIAEYGDMLIHSPIETSDVYAILFHQASYPWALVLQSKLPEIDANVVFETHQIDIPAEQPTGDVYMNAGALHVWRVGEVTEIDTSIDVGAAAGSTVYAPISGTVVLVKEYKLYDVCTDYEVHIQPAGHPELDGVCIHISDVVVGEGEEVVAGVTPLAKVRDIAAEGVDGIHLAQFSDKENGNHAHFQLNDMNYEGYRAAKFASSSEQSASSQPAQDGEAAPASVEQEADAQQAEAVPQAEPQAEVPADPTPAEQPSA